MPSPARLRRNSDRTAFASTRFEVTQRYGPSAVFLSAGGYHHHIGLNTRAGEGAPQPPPARTGLYHFAILLVGGNLPNSGTMFVSLEAFEDRKSPQKSAEAILRQLYAQYAERRDARIVVPSPPAVRGLGATAGFKMMIQDRADLGLDVLGATAFRMMGSGSGTPGLRKVSPRLPRACRNSSWTWIA